MSTDTVVTKTANSPKTLAEIEPVRAHTDESLRAERTNADKVLAEKGLIDEAADREVDSARTTADAVLDRAREEADDKVDAKGRPADALHDVVEKERAHEDSIVKKERAVADARLFEEREHQAVLLESILATERSKTDRYLLSERDRSDDAIVHRDDFLGMVSHDLRNHLSSISSLASVAHGHAPETVEGRNSAEIMKRIQRHAKRMARIVDDLTDVAAIDAGKLVMRPKLGDASMLLAEAEEIFKATAAENNILLVVERGVRPLRACFDYPRMLQVLSNFLSNAIKFTPPNGCIVLRGECDAEELRLTVSDTGPGIPAHLLESVFERFWQTGKNDRRGLGLGLYISKCIVQGHHGLISVETEIGKGSTFIATIPRTMQ